MKINKSDIEELNYYFQDCPSESKGGNAWKRIREAIERHDIYANRCLTDLRSAMRECEEIKRDARSEYYEAFADAGIYDTREAIGMIKKLRLIKTETASA